MWFKLTYSLADMHERRGVDLPTEVRTNEHACIKLWKREVQHQGQVVRNLCCDVIMERAAPARIVEALDSLKGRRLLLDSPPQILLPYTSLSDTIVDTDGRIAPNWIIPLEIMPAQHRAFQRNLRRELAEIIQGFIAALRWRQGATGRHRPFGHVAFDWSDDGATWYKLPSDIRSRLSVSQGFDTRPAALAEVADTLFESTEPFAHELIREAVDLAGTTPRGALLIAMSALETGLKHYVTHLVPDADSLLEKMPSPSVLVLLQEVIPTIHRNRGVNSRQIPLERDAKEFLKKWVTQRNQVAHGIKKDVNVNDLCEFVAFTTDLLYVLDFHRGYTWALERLTSGRIPSN